MSGKSTKIPVWLDCDPGHDDAFAILLGAHHQRLNLLGVSTVHGNASLAKTTSNALSILKSIGKSNISVFPGVQKPFSRERKHAPEIHGDSGLDGTDLLPQPDTLPLIHCNAIKHMRDALMSCAPQEAWLVATGTLTNVALMFAVFPEVAKHLKGLSIMGGAIGGDFAGVYMGPEYTDESGQQCARIGNMTPWAEFNIWCDPEAGQSIFSNPDLQNKTTLITLDLTHQVCATSHVRERILYSSSAQETPTRLRRMFYELLVFFAETYDRVFGLSDGPPLHDPLAMAVLLDAEAEYHPLFSDTNHERWSVEVVTEGEQAGWTKITPAAEGVFVPRSMNVSKFWDLTEECMASADEATGFVKLETKT